ncbi:MAG: hypothetical protein ACTSP4_09030 [Candidatus Hodarchaeales archaeon]
MRVRTHILTVNARLEAQISVGYQMKREGLDGKPLKVSGFKAPDIELYTLTPPQVYTRGHP